MVATGTYSWKHRSTGTPAVVQMPHVWTIRDGKVITMQLHVGTLTMQELSARADFRPLSRYPALVSAG